MPWTWDPPYGRGLERQAGGWWEFGARARWAVSARIIICGQSWNFLNVPAMAQPGAYIGGGTALGPTAPGQRRDPNFLQDSCGIRGVGWRRREPMSIPKIDWNKAFGFAWRILVFIVPSGILIVVPPIGTVWEGGAGCRRTNDAYLQAATNPISAKLEATCGNSRFRDFERVRRVRFLAQLVATITAPPWAQAQAGVAAATAQAQVLKGAAMICSLPTSRRARRRGVYPAFLAQSERRPRSAAAALLATGSSSAEAGEKLSPFTISSRLSSGKIARWLLAARAPIGRTGAQMDQSEADDSPLSALRSTRPSSTALHAVTATQDGVLGRRQVKPGQWSEREPRSPRHALARTLVIANYKETQPHSHERRAEGGDHRRCVFPGHTLPRASGGGRPRVGGRVRAAAARQCNREFHQVRAAHRGQDR